MSTPTTLRADTHVHFHDCFEEGPFLNAAADALFGDISSSRNVDAALCLTESYGANWFERLFGIEQGKSVGDSMWSLQRTEEDNAVVVEDKSARRLAIIAGRQIVCKEGLEVLALGHRSMPKDGKPIREVLQEVFNAGAIPVVPWGFGKWLGNRGEVVKKLIEDPPCKFLLGDNGGRLAMLNEPKLFSSGRDQGFSILPGTDPFPFGWDSRRVGSYGIEWDGCLEPMSPFKSIKEIAMNTDSAGRTFGPLEGLPGFIKNQIAIQLRRFAR